MPKWCKETTNQSIKSGGRWSRTRKKVGKPESFTKLESKQNDIDVSVDIEVGTNVDVDVHVSMGWCKHTSSLHITWLTCME